MAIATWRDAAVALDKNGAVSFHRGAADPCYEVVSVGGGAASIKCGPTDLLVAYADAVRIWAMVVDDKLGQVLLTPKASLNLDAAPARVEAAASATLGLVATAGRALVLSRRRGARRRVRGRGLSFPCLIFAPIPACEPRARPACPVHANHWGRGMAAVAPTTTARRDAAFTSLQSPCGCLRF